MKNDYQAYLVCFQRRSEANTWRATLENAHSSEVVQFASEKELLLFLLCRLSGRHDKQPGDDQADE